MERFTRGAKAAAEVFWERMAILFSPLSRPGGVLEAEKKVPKVAVLVFYCLVYVQERRKMDQTALETALNKLNHVLLFPIFFLPVRSFMI